MVAKAPGVGGAGKIAPSSLEASTVDLSSEFTGLITTQKAYSASSKIITTADQMLDELIQMKR
jgi:flagellar hook protein FlgE